MPRPLRLQFNGAWYHVMNRGAAQKLIYKNNQHRNIFLNLLREIHLYYHIEIHAYCLMDNHYHLLLHTPQGNLSLGMKHLNGIYTQQFNRDEKIDGPLFRGRYRAILIENDPYLLQVSRYIHLNPLEAGLVEKPENYQWSSYKDYIATSSLTPWAITDFIKGMISNDNKESAYQKFVTNGVDEATRKFYKKKKQLTIFEI